ncbi:uncharacterized protein LOC136032822 isoform X1 [Artemia franciscana]|uniref:Methyltransferase FkbM domain-containing protein n=1 Tax=Artemia franciscana TaxID=6661 RepID=A0AA88IB39_ARTSF|nr:hypothetical protein QYM36_001496 [Artemia franciscana]KAK2725059.1 hypothetical protein QYM36_001496 [Artemia franciscana]
MNISFNRFFRRNGLLRIINNVYIFCVTIALWIVWRRQDSADFCSDISKAVDLEMDDPYLIEFIRVCKMQLPTKKEYKLINQGIDIAKNVLDDQYLGYRHFWADAVFFSQLLIPKEKRTKRFFECGASDGEFMSQTYFAERFLGWSGILVEGDPFYFDKMVGKNRKSTQFQLCASTSNKSGIMSFLHIEKGKVNGSELLYPGNGQLYTGKVQNLFQLDVNRVVDVFCVPVYTMLLATNTLSLDIFFLDVEGPELEILKTIPFDKIDVAIFVVEYNTNPEKLKKLKAFFEEKDYILDDNSNIDTLFVKKEYMENITVDISKTVFYEQVKKWYGLKPLVD